MFLNMLCWHEFWLKQCDHYVMSWVFIYDNCWRCLQRVGGTGAVKHISGLQTAQFNTAPNYQLCMYLCWGREIIKLELDNLYSNHYARKELWSTRSPQHVSLSPVLLEPYLSVRAFHTTLKQDPVEGYKDGRSNGKVTAVDGTIAWSLGAGVRNRVRWGLSYYCLHQKDGQRIFLRRTHSQRHKHTTHTQPHAHPIVHIFFFFLEWVSAWIKDIKAAAWVSLLLCCREAPPPTWLLLRRAPIELAWKRQKREPRWKGEQSDPLCTKHRAPPVEQDTPIPPETIMNEAPRSALDYIFFCTNSCHFQDCAV